MEKIDKLEVVRTEYRKFVNRMCDNEKKQFQYSSHPESADIIASRTGTKHHIINMSVSFKDGTIWGMNGYGVITPDEERGITFQAITRLIAKSVKAYEYSEEDTNFIRGPRRRLNSDSRIVYTSFVVEIDKKRFSGVHIMPELRTCRMFQSTSRDEVQFDPNSFQVYDQIVNLEHPMEPLYKGFFQGGTLIGTLNK